MPDPQYPLQSDVVRQALIVEANKAINELGELRTALAPVSLRRLEALLLRAARVSIFRAHFRLHSISQTEGKTYVILTVFDIAERTRGSLR